MIEFIEIQPEIMQYESRFLHFYRKSKIRIYVLPDRMTISKEEYIKLKIYYSLKWLLKQSLCGFTVAGH
jgi:hypothetical protein